MESTADLIVFIGTAVFSLAGIFVVGRMEDEKAKREMKKCGAVAKKGATNYARLKAQLAISSQVIRKG